MGVRQVFHIYQAVLTLCTLSAMFLTVESLSILSEEDNGGQHWALLVAGSNGYYNYRHQADICHAYHVVSKNGIPDERIIVMMYDDIANSSENPFPGNIINEPNGPNVYPGVLKDYTGTDVTPDVFLKVLTGDKEGIKDILGREGKVIESGPNDRIFVNFADHGAPGLLAFPDDLLHAEDLHKAIKQMYKEKLYKQMVFYVEACESGSVFKDILESDINVFVTTAANPDESSYACYYDEERDTYLGDVYSVMWMQDSDKENLQQETLEQQFELVKKETNTSHVQEYGDLTMGKLKVGDFQGGQQSSSSLYFLSQREITHPTTDAVPSESVTLDILMRKVQKSTGEEKEKHTTALTKLLQTKRDTEFFFKTVHTEAQENRDYEWTLRQPVQFTNFKCYRESLRLITDLCPGMKVTQNDYALRNLRVLANLCEMKEIPHQQIWKAVDYAIQTSSICH